MSVVKEGWMSKCLKSSYAEDKPLASKSTGEWLVASLHAELTEAHNMLLRVKNAEILMASAEKCRPFLSAVAKRCEHFIDE
eukprot:4761452-Amphidinium_carterae.1